VSDAEQVPHGVRRWGGYVALVIAFSIACGFLSWWQWSRNAERTAENTLISANWTLAAEPVADLVPATGFWHHDLEWREATLRGTYLADEQLLVRNRVRNDNPGFEVLVPLRLADGRVFVVDRGWLPIPTGNGLPQVPEAPSGEVSVVVRLQQSEPDLPGRTSPAGQVASVDLLAIAGNLAGVERSEVYTGAYGTMTSEDPSPAARPLAEPKPVADPGPFLSYAIQWIAFAVLAFVGLFWAIRRERRLSGLSREERDRFRQARRPSADADYEDAILDRR
jgi:cytochrome oxidase assembly protein ShyY1